MYSSKKIYNPQVLKNNIEKIQEYKDIPTGILRGIEREALRVDFNGRLSNKKHPDKLGSALTNKKITTDYSEALLELITDTHDSIESLLKELRNTHYFVCDSLEKEILWHQSMPPLFMPSEENIPIADYGNSNLGLFKHIYRKGLANRYGKTMQCISGLHYNFSIKHELWSFIYGKSSEELESIKSKRYLGLIRNFIRYSWIILYLFGSSPAISKTFFKSKHDVKLETLDHDTLYMPYATSLRMSSLGYQSSVQENLKITYNTLDSFVDKINWGLNTPWPEYEKIGIIKNKEWLQLNANILQIENEYYSSIRPKCNVINSEKQIEAIKKRGIEYIEVRCLDIDQTSSLGITKNTCLFMDAFLLFCALSDSPYFTSNDDCNDYYENFSKVAVYGRQPGLTLKNNNSSISLKEWGINIIEQITPFANLLDKNDNDKPHYKSLNEQIRKMNNVELTPSYSIINSLKTNSMSLNEYTLDISKKHNIENINNTLDNDLLESYKLNSIKSLELQRILEENSTCSFEEFLKETQI
ncbi:glutamate--cysteine ligase [Candidatus Kinetoplastibacterium desouzaii TCC079E]|uniref:Glutamate--cysteine ligase n=1 Tax=Candidatus Kinetoplastidibacterium desouzai TCC079E TaxID=1208919 RepID=M1LR30_9PROT|nr:glutamate--cysteine ligase [Candidatus Kinetoplastibacterium desouzaii]AGF46621.1 glutamate--cysteine ligase [Candidatus Kinetoplastibacterium desouzaii TCC079E]